MCELASLDGEVVSLAAGPTGIYACATSDASTEVSRITRDARDELLLTVPGECVRVVLSEPFVYVGTRGALGGVYRGDLTGAGLHLEVPEPGLTDFAVHDGVVSMATGGRSTPVTVSPVTGVRESMRGFEQSTESGPLFALGDGRLVWSVAARREVLVTTLAGVGSPLLDLPAPLDPISHAFLLAADADGAVVIDDDRVIALEVDAVRFPVEMARGLVRPHSIALTPTEAIVADEAGIHRLPRTPGTPERLSGALVSTVAATEGGEVFAAVGPKVFEVRRIADR